MKDTFDIVLITHGSLSKGYYDALQVILDIGEEDLYTISFENGEALDVFSEKISNVINDRLKDRNLFVLTDLPGGSPANVSLPFLSSKRRFVSGINLPFLLELMIAKKNQVAWEDIHVENLMNNAIASMVYYNQLMETEEIK